MGLTDTQKNLIEAIAKNNMPDIKKTAINCLKEDKTQKNKQFCERYIKQFERNELNFIKIPHSLEGLLYEEDISQSFNENRYYLSSRGKELFNEIRKMNQVSSILTAMQIKYTNTALLYGESGTGKTMFGRYVAYKMNLPFCYVNISQIIDSYMGNTAKNITKVFDYISTHPCVFMIDEIDSISNRRKLDNSNGVDGELSRTTMAIMQELDKVNNNVIIIATTNRKDRLDEALLRRFTIQHQINKMKEKEQHDVVIKFLDDLKFEIPYKEIEQIISEKMVQSKTMQKLIQCISNHISKELIEDSESSIFVQSKDNTNKDYSNISFTHNSWVRDACGIYRCSHCHQRAKTYPLTTYCPDCGTKLIHRYTPQQEKRE